MVWRQGHVLTAAHLATVGIDSELGAVGVVASHDCDLVARPELEPFAELVLGSIVEAPNGGLQHAKSTRRLHIELGEGNNVRFLELDATRKCVVKKEAIFAIDHTECERLGQAQIGTLRAWLAARYKRAAFPNNFDIRMKPVDVAIDKICRKFGKAIRGLFFDLSDDREVEHEDNVPYEIGVYVVYTGSEEEVEAHAKQAASEIEAAFKKEFGDNDQKKPQVKLTECIPIWDEEITLQEVSRLMNRRMEHRSLAVDPAQATPHVDE